LALGLRGTSAVTMSQTPTAQDKAPEGPPVVEVLPLAVTVFIAVQTFCAAQPRRFCPAVLVVRKNNCPTLHALGADGPDDSWFIPTTDQTFAEMQISRF